MLKWFSKFVLDILPSVVATILGAFIVNHYIIPKTATPAAAVSAAVDPIAGAKTVDRDAAEQDKGAADKPSMADKSPASKVAAEKKASFENAVAEKAAIEKTAEKAAEKSADTVHPEPRRHQPSRTAGKAAPVATASVGPAEASAGDERRGVNDLARAAIERARNSGSGEAARAPEVKPAEIFRGQAAARAPEPPRATQSLPPMQPLPPAINVAAPNPDVFESGAPAAPVRQSHPVARVNETDRPSPPVDIPASRPIDLRAEASVPGRSSVADDVMSAAKSVFHAVVPRSN